ncbi:MAG: TetR/AcrR family transcriptional regulator [Comamonadaceae bacterium]|nr:MAG: TetR/AcrR family transcriptional regulator [Comamonadaceae bacterium]
MKVSKEQMAENRERILDTAAQLFRERGFDGIGVADLMKGAGLTHGGFYGHFSSKEDLMAQACARALEQSRAQWQSLVDETTENPRAMLERAYLCTPHRDTPGRGCLMAALGADAARQGPGVRSAVTQGLHAMVDLLSSVMPGRTKAARRQKALADYASLVGALVLARAVDDAALSDEILQATAAALQLPPQAAAGS